MLRRSLELMRERGQVLSGLYTPHPALYRRFGWEIAADERIYEFKPKDLQLSAHPAQRGRLRYVKQDDWRLLDVVFRRYAQKRNGPLQRDEMWWRNWVLERWIGRVEAVVWENASGVPEGYLVFLDPIPPQRDTGRVSGLELVSLNSDAYLNLVSFLGNHDIREQVTLYAPTDDPLPLLFSDAERLTTRSHYTALLRVVDVPAALRARPPVDESLDFELRLAVADATAPWNQATWRVRVADGTTLVEPTQDEGEIELDARVLAPVFNGYLAPSRGAAAGLLRARSEDALVRADAFFAAWYRPYFTDSF
jgi:predicted acetyltransferase